MERCLGLGVRLTSIFILTAMYQLCNHEQITIPEGSLFICEMGMQIAPLQKEERFLAQYLEISRCSVNGEYDSTYH